MPREYRELGYECAMGDRNTSVGRAGDRRTDARHNFKFQSALVKVFRFFASTAKDNGITALDSSHHFSCGDVLSQQRIDVFLRQRVILRFFPDINGFSVRSGIAQQIRTRKVVVGNDVCLLNALLGTQSQ